MEILRERILITGADGFIGSHLTEYLLKKGARVKALSCYNSFNNWGWLESLKGDKNLEIVSGDIRDPYFCSALTKEIDVIFHLAALIAIPYSYVAPSSYVDTNVTGTLNICQAALQHNCKRIIHTSTSEVYGTAQYVPMDEKHPLQPQSPYSASKISADAMAMSFYNSFNLPVVIARPFNTYGPRQSARAVIPTMISQIAAGHREIEVGDLTPTRDLTFVADTVKGFVCLAECEEAVGETINIGTGQETTIEQVFGKIKELMGSDVEYVVDPKRIRPGKSEVFRLWASIDKIQALTGYAPSYSLEAGLAETIRWFVKPDNLNQYKTNIYNL